MGRNTENLANEAVSLLFSSEMPLPSAFVMPGLIVFATTSSFTNGAIYLLLSGSYNVVYAHEFLKSARVVVDDLSQLIKQLVVQEALIIILSELLYFLLFISVTKRASERGRDDDP